jgi:hypothetical protein
MDGWFGEVSITPEDKGETLLTGPVEDQAALYGLLRKVRDLGLPLISVTRAQADQIDGQIRKAGSNHAGSYANAG